MLAAADRGSQHVGFEFKASVAADADDWKHLQAGIDDGVIHRGHVYNGVSEFPRCARCSASAVPCVMPTIKDSKQAMNTDSRPPTAFASSAPLDLILSQLQARTRSHPDAFRQLAGEAPNWRLKARLNAASDS